MTRPPDPYQRREEDIREPPVGFWNRLKFVGPGVILVGSVVGSGEIMMTTTLGATVGFVMLWWMLLSCWGKSIIQVELARYTVSSGETALHAFNRLPGKVPARGRTVSWFMLYWLVTMIPGHLGGGGIFGGTGQAVHEMLPLLSSEWWTVVLAGLASVLVLSGTYLFLERLLLVMVVTFTFVTLMGAISLQFTPGAITWNDVAGGLRFQFPAYAVGIALAAYGGTGVTAGESMSYTYWCIEKGYARYAGPTSGGADWVRRARGWIRVMQLDVMLTLGLLTMATVPFYMLGAGVLYRTPVFVFKAEDRAAAVSEEGIPEPLRQRFSRAGEPLSNRLVIATDVPGERWSITDEDREEKYVIRRRGDQVGVYQMPDGLETIRTLSKIYTQTLGPWAWWLFMIGAFFVLYSTVISGLGSGARTFADGMGILGFIDSADYAARVKILRIWAVVSPAITCACYFAFPNPIWLLTIGGVFAALMTPIVGAAVLYLRYRHLDRRIAPTRLTDVALWICVGIVFALSGYVLYRQFLG